MEKIKDKATSIEKKKNEPSKEYVQHMMKYAKGDFREAKTAFGRLHQFLVTHSILDGSSDSLVEDITDGSTPELIIDQVVARIGNESISVIAEKLAYLALGGIFKVEISIRLRRYLYKHLEEAKKAKAAKDFEFMNSIAMENGLPEEELIKVLNSRIQALRDVLALRGNHFLKRAKYVAPGFKVKRT